MKIENHRLVNVRFSCSPNFNDRPENEKIRLLVIHNISLPPRKYGTPYVEQLFLNCLDPKDDPCFDSIHQLQVSAHLFIRRTGEVIQFVPFNKRAWHAGKSSFNGQENCNDFSIGIELEGCDVEPFTDLQYQQLAEITHHLKQNYPIEAITGHYDIAPDRKTDPGAYFNWQYYKQLLEKK